MDTIETVAVYSRETSDATMQYAKLSKTIADAPKKYIKQYLANRLLSTAYELKELAKHYAEMVGMLESAEEELNEQKLRAAKLDTEVMTLEEQLAIASYQRDDLAKIIAQGCTKPFGDLLQASIDVEFQ